MALYFEQVNLLDYSHAPVTFGAGLVYRLEKRLSITGTIFDRNAVSGTSSMIEKEGLIIAGATDYEDIYLNGVLFGQGKITSIRFDGGTMVRQDQYIYDIVCYEEGNLFNAASGAYTGIDWTNARIIDSLSETLSFENNDDGRKSYNHAISIRFGEQVTASAAIALAKAFAAQMFSAVSGLGQFIGQYDTIGSAQKVYAENYNNVDGSCSFSENVIIPANQGANSYSTEYSYSSELGEDGYVTITETTRIQGVNAPRALSAETGYLAQKAGAFARCQVVYAAYGFSTLPLVNASMTSVVARNKFDGSITFTNRYTTNPSYTAQARWEYSIEIVKRDNARIITESGSVRGHGRAMADKYANAKAFFDASVAPSAVTRATSIYTTDGGFHSLKATQQSFSKNEFNGTISYKYTWTDDNLYDAGSFKSISTTATISQPVAMAERFEVFNQLELVQSQRQNSLGRISLSIQIKGLRDTSLATYLTEAEAFIASYSSVGTDNFIANCTYSHAPLTNDFSLNADLSFVGTPKSFTDLSLDAV